MSNFDRDTVYQNELIELSRFLNVFQEEVEPMGVDVGENFLDG